MRYIILMTIITISSLGAQNAIVDTFSTINRYDNKSIADIKTTVKFDALQKIDGASFEIILENFSDKKVNIRSLLFSLDYTLSDENSSEVKIVSIYNSNTMPAPHGSARFRKSYDQSNKAFDVEKIVSNRRELELEDWYGYEWFMLPNEIINCKFKIKYVSALEDNRTCVGRSEEEYKPIYPGKFQIRFSNPLVKFNEDRKIINSYRNVSKRFNLTLE